MSRITHPAQLLRLEGAVLLAASLFFYWRVGGDGWLFLLLILAPDLAMLGYLAGAEIGASAYNLFHIELWPAVLAILGVTTGNAWLLATGLIWFAHLGADRLMGFGLKYPTAFKDTHLNRV
jgi:hypothetical protein